MRHVGWLPILALVASLQVLVAQAGAEVVLSLSQVQGIQGKRVTVPLHLSGQAVPGIISLRIRILYDPTWLTFAEMTAGDLPKAAGFLTQANAMPSGSEYLLAISMAGSQVMAGEGKLADLVFSIAQAAPAGTEITLRFAADTRANRGQPELVLQDGSVAVQAAPPLPADFNRDGVVDFKDFFLFADHYGTRPTSPDWDPAYDLVANSLVDLRDFFAFVDTFGQRR